MCTNSIYNVQDRSLKPKAEIDGVSASKKTLPNKAGLQGQVEAGSEDALVTGGQLSQVMTNEDS